MQQTAEVDLDRLVDYKTEYCSVIKKHKITGDNLTGLCPFHDDRANSFSVDLKTGMWHCFAEDEGGNFVTFYAKLNGLDTKEAYKQILEKYGALKGSLLAIWRILRCNPFSKGGYDPVP